MKAYHILMFLFIFNMFFWVVTDGIGIYRVPYQGNENFNISSDKDVGNWTSNETTGLISKLFLFGSLPYASTPVISIFALALVLVTAAFLGGYVTQGLAPQGIVYGLFAYFFWSSMSNTLMLLFNLTGGNLGALYILVIFGMIIGIIFVVGLMQMVTGGWQGFE